LVAKSIFSRVFTKCIQCKPNAQQVLNPYKVSLIQRTVHVWSNSSKRAIGRQEVQRSRVNINAVCSLSPSVAATMHTAGQFLLLATFALARTSSPLSRAAGCVVGSTLATLNTDASVVSVYHCLITETREPLIPCCWRPKSVWLELAVLASLAALSLLLSRRVVAVC
jgi:hypothetical protein